MPTCYDIIGKIHIENYTVCRFGYKTTYKTNSLIYNLYTDRQITYASYLAYKTNSLIRPIRL